MEKSKIFIISGPSGAGEHAILAELTKKIKFERIITTSTRDMRPGEEQGKPYYFISKEEFQKGIDNGAFFEHVVEDRGNLYGTSKKEVERVMKLKSVVVLNVEYNGVAAMKEAFPDDVIAILITAPLDVLEMRIRTRDKATDEYVRGRMEYAKGWFENRKTFDYEVENQQGHLDETVAKVIEIINKHSN